MTDAADETRGAGTLAAERRAALAEATVEEFARSGYESASLNRIIRRAGMSKSSFYHFVGSKDELFDAVVRMLIAEVRDQWTPPAPPEFGARAFWRRVDALLEEVMRLSATPAMRRLGQIFFLHGEAGSGVRAELVDDVRSWVGAVLQIGREAGQVRDDLPLELQTDVTFAVLRAVDDWAFAGGDGVIDARAAVAASAPAVLLRRMLAV